MRTRISVLSVLFLAAAALSAATPAAEKPACEAEILRLESVWNEAHLHGDVEALDRLWAPDLSVIVPEMQPFTKQQLLEMWRTMRVSFTRYATSDVQLRCDGSTAVVTGRLQRSRDFGGKVRSEDWLFTKTYAEIDGRWQVVAYHASATPAP